MHPMLNIATQAARKAGKLLLKAQERLDMLQIHPKGRQDYSTNVDHASEKIIIEEIRKHYPQHNILAEESGYLDGTSEQAPLWIIDPLDGTKNYTHGHPHFCISIAVQIKGVFEVGLIYDPLREELFSAVRNQGAQKDGKRLRLKNNPILEEALLCFSMARTEEADVAHYWQHFLPLVTQCSGIRNSGSACLDLAYLASGRIDGLIQSHLKLWDIAAGILIAQEAGATVTNFKGISDPAILSRGQLLVAPPKLHDLLLPTCAQA